MDIKNNYILFCNEDRIEEINDRIFNRNIPSQSLQPEFSLRPSPTQRTIFPIVNPSLNSCVKLKEFPIFNIEKVFNPGNAQAPWSGFANNIDVNSSLRNQFFALQKAPQSKFIPSTNSSLYTNNYLPTYSNIQQNNNQIIEQERSKEDKKKIYKNISSFNISSRLEREKLCK